METREIRKKSWFSVPMHAKNRQMALHPSIPSRGEKNVLTLICPIVTLRADVFIRQRLPGNQRSRY
jgi:hypothetical protein